MIRRERGTEWRWAHGTAVELQEEAVFASAEAKQPVTIRSDPAVSARDRVAPLHESPLTLSACRACDRGKDIIGAKRVGEIGEQRATRPDRCLAARGSLRGP